MEREKGILWEGPHSKSVSRANKSAVLPTGQKDHSTTLGPVLIGMLT